MQSEVQETAAHAALQFAWYLPVRQESQGGQALGLGQFLQHLHFQCHTQARHSCCLLYLTSTPLLLWLRTGCAGGVLGNNHWHGPRVVPGPCPENHYYNIRFSLSANHYTRRKSVSCPKTQLTRSKLILKNINPKTDLRHMS